MANPSMTPMMLARVAEQFRSLAEPSRLALMNLLFDGECTVGELVEQSGLSLANASKHLGILHRAGWLDRRKEGQTVVYSLADERTQQLCDIMCRRVRELAAVEAELAAPMPRRRAARS